MLSLIGYKPVHRNIVTRRLHQLHQEHLANLIDELKSIDTISITTDFWTDRNSRSFLVLTGHYCTRYFELKSKVLSFSQFSHRHTSVQIASCIHSKLEKLNITTKINRIITDGANNMKLAVELLNLNAKYIWCVAHRLHLTIVNGLGLWSKKKNTTTESLGNI